MSEAATAEDIAAIRKELRDLQAAQERLAEAKTPAAKADAREDVRDAKDDLDDELRRRGLSRSDLDKLQEEKEFERHKAREDRLRTEREAEEKNNPKPKRKPVAKTDDSSDDDAADDSDDAPNDGGEETPPASQHWADKPLWGRKGEG